MSTLNKPERIAYLMRQIALKAEEAKFEAHQAGRTDVAWEIEKLIGEVRRVHDLAASAENTEIFRRKAA